MTLYRIRDWDKHFESSRTRKLKNLTWVPIPNRMDGGGYTTLADGGVIEYLGVWLALVEIASRCTPRGTLIRSNGTPHTPQSLAVMALYPNAAETFAKAIDRLASPEVGWIERLTFDENGSWQNVVPEWKGMEQKNEFPIGNSCGELQATSPPVLTFPVVGGKHEWHLTQSKLDEYADSFPAVDVLRECKAARQWCIDKPRNRKTYSGMPAFLSRWLTKSQNSARPINGSPIDYAGEMQRRLGVSDA